MALCPSELDLCALERLYYRNGALKTPVNARKHFLDVSPISLYSSSYRSN